MIRSLLFAAFVAYANAQAPGWDGSFVSRLEALALIQILNGEVLASRSATASLEKWCRDHDLAKDPKIVARQVPGVRKDITEEHRRRLKVDNSAQLKYRRVELRCGGQILSTADNWYVPERLTPEMNRLLETTTTPFGKAVQPLEPHRETYSVKILWSPLPEGWDRQLPAPPETPSTPLRIPEALFEHRAILYNREHEPFSEVHETYRREILMFRK